MLPLLVMLFACGSPAGEGEAEGGVQADLPEIISRGSLRIIITESAFSYYVDDEENEYGYDYDLARNFADYLQVEPLIIVAENEADMMEKLLSGEGDVIAHGLYPSPESKGQVLFVEKQTHRSHFALVQRRSKERVSSVSDLVGRTVYVNPHDRACVRLRNLNEELGGGIVIADFGDSVSVEELVYRVSRERIDYAVVDFDLAMMLARRLHNLDLSLPVGFDHTKSWAVRASSPLLHGAVAEWARSVQGSRYLATLHRRYILHNDFFERTNVEIPAGSISPYDEAFHAAAAELGWDWRMLAAIAYKESRFNGDIISNQGARGIMQMMPRTAARFGLQGDDVLDPEKCIKAGAQYLKYIDMIFRRIQDKEERMKFVIASYNCGPGHVFDAMALADHYGHNQFLWSDVTKYLLLKNNPEYYRNPVCKHGFFRARHTVKYVDQVYDIYNSFCKETEK